MKQLPGIFLLLLTAACSVAAPCRNLEGAFDAAAELRNIPGSSAPGCAVVSREQFIERLDALFSQDLQSGELVHEETALKLIGFLPRAFPYAECLVEDAILHVGAFYLPEEKAVIIPGWQEIPQNVLVHEAVHALQDSRYNLGKLRDAATGSTDAQLALAALVEGDAAVIQDRFLEQQPAVSERPETEEPTRCALPETLAHQYEFPYTSGRRMIERARELGGDDALEKLFANPPKTTSAVMYQFSKRPELAAFSPVTLEPAAPASDGDEWLEVDRDVLGEYTIRTLLREQVGSRGAIKAALGWRGDQYRLFTDRGMPPAALLVWESAWATPAHAREFFEGYRVTLRGYLQQQGATHSLHTPTSDTTLIDAGADGRYELTLHGSQVTLRAKIDDRQRLLRSLTE